MAMLPPGTLYGLGAEYLLERVVASGDAPLLYLHLSTSTIPFQPSDSFPALYPEPLDEEYLAANLLSYLTINGLGDATATLQWQEFFFGGDYSVSQNVTQWWIEAPSAEALVAYGVVSPPFATPVGGFQIYDLNPITLVIGTCSPSATPYLLLIGADSPNGTALTAYTPDVGPVATTYTGSGTLSATIQARTVQLYRNTGGESSALWDLGTSSYTLSTWLTVNPATEDAGVLVRAADHANGWLIDLDGTLGLVVLYQLAGGVFTAIDSVSLSGAAAHTHYAEVTCSGDTISVAVDYSDTLSYGSATANSTATLAGVFLGGEYTTPSVQFSGLNAVPL